MRRPLWLALAALGAVSLPGFTNTFNKSTVQPAARPAAQPSNEPDLVRANSLEAVRLASLPEAVLDLRDGRRLTGEILDEDSRALLINLAGIETEILKVDIRTIRRLPPALDRYRTMRGTLAPNDADSRVVLAQWLRDRQLFAEALTEVENALIIIPGHPGATRLQTWLEAQLRMRRVAAPEERAAPDRIPIDPARRRPTARAEVPRLTNADVNTIRVYEVDLADPPRMRVSRETISDLIQTYSAHPAIPDDAVGRAELFELNASEFLELLFQMKARDFYSRVMILEDPKAMQAFRRDLHGRAGWLVNSCGSVRCHGGTEAGAFQLATDRVHSDETVYTNFYILDNTTLPDGTPLIRHDDPGASPLLQFAMRREHADRPHPELDIARGPRAWRPVFTGPSDSKYRKAVEWIQMLYRPRPDYGLDYQVPSLHPQTAQSDTSDDTLANNGAETNSKPGTESESETGPAPQPQPTESDPEESNGSSTNTPQPPGTDEPPPRPV